MRFVSDFAPETIRGIARYVRRMLATIKARPKNRMELALALTAARIVVTTLERACVEAQVDPSIGDELVDDAGRVMDLVRWK